MGGNDPDGIGEITNSTSVAWRDSSTVEAYLTARGLRLRAGRLLADRDTETSQPVLVPMDDRLMTPSPLDIPVKAVALSPLRWPVNSAPASSSSRARSI
jgi:hypothetical protein